MELAAQGTTTYFMLRLPPSLREQMLLEESTSTFYIIKSMASTLDTLTVNNSLVNQGTTFQRGFARMGPMAVQGELTVASNASVSKSLEVLEGLRTDGLRALSDAAAVAISSDLAIADTKRLCMGSTSAVASKCLTVMMKAGEPLVGGEPLKVALDAGEAKLYRYTAADATAQTKPLIAGTSTAPVDFGGSPCEMCLSGICKIGLEDGASVAIGDYLEPSLAEDGVVRASAKSSQTVATALEAAVGTPSGATKISALMVRAL